MRVLGNIRLSRETDESTSPARQRAGLKAWAEALGHEIVGWAEDIDVSGGLSPWERENLGRWLTDQPPLDYDIIASTKIDRLSRDLGDFVDLIDWASSRGRYIVAYMDSVDTSTPTGELVAKVLAIFAEFERKTIAARNADSRRLATEEGRWHGGTVPYGYMPVKMEVGKGWRLTPDPESKAQFEQIVARLLAGQSLNHIASELNAAAILPPSEFYRQRTDKPLSGLRWTGTSLKVMLRSRAPLGVMERDGEVVRGVDGLPVRRAEAIISRADWDLVQMRLDEITKTRPRSYGTSPLLQIAFCIDCGMPLYRQIKWKMVGGEQKGYEYYRCRGWRDKLNGCKTSSLHAEDLTLAVEKALLEAIGGLQMVEEVYHSANDHSQELQEASEALTDLLIRSAGKSEAVQKVYQGQIEALEALIERLSALPTSSAYTEQVETGATYRELWEASDWDERRALLLKAGVRIEAGPVKDGWLSVGRFERPERYDQAVLLGAQGKLRYALYLPRDLAERASRR